MLTAVQIRDTISSFNVWYGTLVYFFFHLDDVESRKYADRASPHVVALTPQVLRLGQHQHRVVSLQAQLILVAGNKPDDGLPQNSIFNLYF